jgi:hypothetical protein
VNWLKGLKPGQIIEYIRYGGGGDEYAAMDRVIYLGPTPYRPGHWRYLSMWLSAYWGRMRAGASWEKVDEARGDNSCRA